MLNVFVASPRLRGISCIMLPANPATMLYAFVASSRLCGRLLSTVLLYSLLRLLIFLRDLMHVQYPWADCRRILLPAIAFSGFRRCSNFVTRDPPEVLAGVYGPKAAALIIVHLLSKRPYYKCFFRFSAQVDRLRLRLRVLATPGLAPDLV